MKASSGFVCARSVIYAAGALIGLLALGGCGGGGGGAGSGLVGGGSFEYPSSLGAATSVGGFISPYAIDTAGSSLVSVDTSVFGQSPSSGGKITITVDDMRDKTLGTVIEPGFVVTFDPSAMPAQFSKSPLDSLSPSCGTGCLKTGTVDDNHGAPVTFIYLDSAKAGLTYSALGMWTKDITGSPDWSQVGGAFSAGVLTRGIDLPTTGSAQYNGYFIGTYTTSVDQTTPSTFYYSAGSYVVGANAGATANFVARTVTFSTSNTYISVPALPSPVRESRLDLSTSAPMTIPPGSSSFTGGNGTLTNGFSMGATGQIAGGFYGQPDTSTGLPSSPPELGGSLSVGNTTQSMVGSFALKKTSSTP